VLAETLMISGLMDGFFAVLIDKVLDAIGFIPVLFLIL